MANSKLIMKSEEQGDLFPEEPVVRALAITDFKMNGAEIQAKLVGVTNINDAARLDAVCWQHAVAEWLIALHKGDIDQATIDVKKAYVHYVNINEKLNRTSDTVNIHSPPDTVSSGLVTFDKN